ncbi:MAG: PilZ domain-containing protein [Desulfobacterales bacterium]|nr:PilZ domain-containing protein [Desulfobacterales bacterium]
MKVSKIVKGFSGEKLQISCDRCDYKASFMIHRGMGRGRVLNCPCGAKFGIIVERRRYTRKKPSTHMVGMLNDGATVYDIRIHDISIKGLGIKLVRGETNLALNDDVHIVFSLGDSRPEVIKDTIKVVALRDGFVGGLMDENSDSQKAIFTFLQN